MITSHLRELCTIVQGTPLQESASSLPFEGATFDSREIRGGELFVALRGEQVHGHQFVNQALDAGAALVLIEDASLPVNDPTRVLVVSDTLIAFQKVAHWWRRRCNTPLVAVTGSVGKTTVKEIAARVLLEAGRGLYSKKSFNNHVGVPYTLCALSPDHAWAVIEMGMNHEGELTVLSQIAEPDHVMITMIAPAHIEYFGTLEKIADAKLEILRGLRPHGTILLNADDTVLLARFAALRTATNETRPVRYFGSSEVRATTLPTLESSYSDVTSHALAGIHFTLSLHGESRPVHAAMLGVHNAMNSAAASLAARSVVPELPIDSIVKGLERYTSSLMRLQIRSAEDGSQVVDDSYNANPASMSALLDLAAEVVKNGNKVGLVLGDMREMGDAGPAAHEVIGQKAAALRPAFLIGVGEYGEQLVASAREQGIETVKVTQAEDAVPLVLARAWEVLFVKASRGTELDKVVTGVFQVKREC